MNDFLMIVSGVFLAIAAALTPKKSREAVRSVVTGSSGSGQGGNAINVYNLLSDRALTETEVKALAAHIVDYYGFNVDVKLLVATAWIESSFRPWVYRHEKRADGTIWDTSYGLMQTLVGTAADMYAKGYRDMGEPTTINLKSPYVSMYFGAAYFDWLKRNWANKPYEWYVRAYNGGPGWEGTPNGAKNTAVYYQKHVNAYKMFSLDVQFG